MDVSTPLATPLNPSRSDLTYIHMLPRDVQDSIFLRMTIIQRFQLNGLFSSMDGLDERMVVRLPPEEIDAILSIEELQGHSLKETLDQGVESQTSKKQEISLSERNLPSASSRTQKFIHLFIEKTPKEKQYAKLKNELYEIDNYLVRIYVRAHGTSCTHLSVYS